MKRLIVSSLAFAISNTNALAWDDSGHETVAQIAYDELTAESPSAKAALDEIFAADPRKRNILTASTWPDFIIREAGQQSNSSDPNIDQKQGVYIDGNWHYLNIPYDATPDEIKEAIEDHGATPDPANPKSANVVIAIRFYTKRLATLEPGSALQKADALSFLIHFIGDIHQPLHSVSVLHAIPGYDPIANGKSDRGGNGFAIIWPVAPWHPHQDNLHALWDDQLDLGANLPVNQIPQTAKALEAENPLGNFKATLDHTDPADWAMEGYEYREFVYSTTYNRTPSEDYLKMAKQIADKRIALAGYRLAKVLKSVLCTPAAATTR